MRTQKGSLRFFPLLCFRLPQNASFAFPRRPDIARKIRAGADGDVTAPGGMRANTRAVSGGIGSDGSGQKNGRILFQT